MKDKFVFNNKYFILFISIFCIFLFSSGVLGNYFVDVRNPNGEPTNLSVRIVEDVQAVFNISINNTAVAAVNNITQVNITLPSSFTFVSASNATFNNTGGNVSFGGTDIIITFNATATSAYGSGNTLSWNSTNGLVFNNTNTFFHFNVTAATPGSYNITVTMMNSSGGAGSGIFNVTNISIIVNDTTIPSNITFQGLTPANGSYLRGDSIFVNFSAYDNGALQSLMTTLVNSTGAVLNVTGLNVSTFFSNLTAISSDSQEVKLNTNFTINFTNLAEGVYYLNASLNDTFGNRNSSMYTRTITLDRTFPAPSYGTGTDTTNTYFKRNFIIVNISVVEIYHNSTNISLMNSSGGVVKSNASLTLANGESLYINFTGLSDGVYQYNVSVNDSAGNINTTLGTRNITLDNVAPTITLSCTPSTNIKTDSTLTCSCSSTDSLDADATETYTANPSTANTGTFTTSCTSIDDTNNSATANLVYTIELNSGGGGSSSGSSSGTNSIIVPWSKTITPDSVKLSNGYDVELKGKERVSVSVPVNSGGSGGSEEHHVGVVSVNRTAATIEVASAPQRVTLSIGESRKFELTGDKYYDILVTLNSVSLDKKANVKIKSINELLPGETADETTDDVEVAEEQGASAETQGSSLKSILIAIIIAILVVVAIIFVVVKRKNSR